jgi:hypothetical protein
MGGDLYEWDPATDTTARLTAVTDLLGVAGSAGRRRVGSGPSRYLLRAAMDISRSVCYPP